MHLTVTEYITICNVKSYYPTRTKLVKTSIVTHLSCRYCIHDRVTIIFGVGFWRLPLPIYTVSVTRDTSDFKYMFLVLSCDFVSRFRLENNIKYTHTTRIRHCRSILHALPR